MGMLDSDSEELKRQNERSDGEVNSSGSGRKVNQSGLGALKHLAKINNLTAKHRSQVSVTAKSASVEQSVRRGTLETNATDSDSNRAQKGANAGSPEISEDRNISDSKQVHNSLESGSETAAASLLIGEESTAMEDTKQSQNGFNSDLLNVQSDSQISGLQIDSALKNESKDLKSPAVVSQVEGDFTDDTKYRGNITEPNRVQIEPLMVNVKPNNMTSPSSGFDKRSQPIEVQNGNKTDSKQVRNGTTETTLVNSMDGQVVETKRVQNGFQSGSRLKRASTAQMPSIDVKQVRNGFKLGSKVLEPHATDSDHNESQIGFNTGSFRTQSEDQREKMINPAVRIFKDDRHSGKSSDAEPDSVLAISGSQKAVLELIFKLCVFNNSMVCPPISKFQISSETGLSELTVKTALRRLGEKAYISLFEFKRGKSGWSKFEIAEKSYKELIQLRGVAVHANLTQAPAVQRHEVRTNEPEPQRATWFRSLDFTKVSPINPMQVNVTIRNLVQSNLDPEMVQEFINRFTSWLATQGKVSSPIGLFCDKLKELATEGESAVLLAVTDEERAAQNAYLEKVEKIRLENEIAEKARARDFQRDIDDKFAIWYTKASQEDQESLCKPSQIAPFGTDNYRSVLKLAFGEKLITEQASKFV